MKAPAHITHNIMSNETKPNRFVSENATITPPATSDDATPNATWATWALLNEANKPDPQTSALFLCRDRLDAISNQASSPTIKRYVVATEDGYWGRGKSLSEAAEDALLIGGGRWKKAFVTIVLNDETPEINAVGALITEACAEVITVGGVDTLKSILPKKELKA